ncbi:MAG: hypothetical protein EXS63_01080 [Candidatus Omnitrophica bacterium]|nr:hypothetical protein [Candidatus Omnitrophota bacterium]
MTKKNEIIKDASIYLALSIVTQLITLIAGLLTRRFLGPTQMGAWSLLQVILNYSSYSTFGVSESISREVPYYRGKGDLKTADQMKNIIFSFSLLTAALISLGALVYALVYQSRLSEVMFYGLLFIGGLVILQRISNLSIAFLRGYKLFTLAGKQMVLSSIVNGILVAILSYKFRMYGFMLAMCLSFVFNIICIRCYYSFHFRFDLNWKILWGMVCYGFPLMITGFLGTLFLSIDKIMIAKFLGLRELGIYSLAILAYTYIGTIPTAVGVVLMPNFHERYGETEKADALKGYLMKSSLAFSDLMPLLIAGVWFFAPYFSRIILPDFLESIAPMKALILGSYFLALINPFNYFMAVIRKQAFMVPIMLVACGLAFVSNYLAIKGHTGIIGVSIATTIVQFVEFATTYWIASSYIFNRRETIGHFALLFIKFVLLTGLLFALDRLIPGSEQNLWKVLLQFGIFLLIYSPFLIKLNKELDLLKVFKNKFIPKPPPPQEELLEN